MKRIGIATVFAVILSLIVATGVFALVTNGDFETGDFTGWVKSAFINDGMSAAHGAGGTDLSAIVGGPAAVPLSLSDPHTNNVIKYPAYGHYSARVNSDQSYDLDGNGSGTNYAQNANVITQNITAVLNPGDSLEHIRFAYAAAMVLPGPSSPVHTDENKPYFRVRVINASNANDVVYDFQSYVDEPGKNWQDGPTFGTGSDSWKYIDWQYIDLKSSDTHPVSAGNNILIEITASGCALGGHPGYVYVDEITDGDVAGPTINATGPATTYTGGTITYTYTYNNGSSGPILPTVTSTQPTGVTFTSVSDVVNCALVSGKVTCNFPSLAAGASGTFTISGTVTAAGGSQIAHGDYDIAATGFPTVGGQTVFTNVPTNSLTINQAIGQADPTSASPVHFTAVFSNAVTGFNGADVTLSASTVSGALSAAVTGGPTTYDVAVSGMTSSGDVIATIAADVTTEGNSASTSTDNVVTFNNAVPEIQVLDTTTDIPDGTGSVDFGASLPGTNITKTFTVTNTGTGALTLTAPITVPAGFTLTASFGSTSLAPAASTTFQVTLSAKSVGTYTGQVSFANNDANENPFNFTITGIMGPAISGSTALHDGWILESAKGSGKGGLVNSTETIVRIGDNAVGCQYRAILSFKARNIPANATIVSARLFVRKAGVIGVDPMTTHGALLVDIITPYFGTNILELTDFAATAGRNAVGTIGTTQWGNYYIATISAGGLPFISKTGYTQLRLRFATPTDNDGNQDFVAFYSGDITPNTGSYFPYLEITYTVP